jgi:hypothetical protein
MYRHAYFYLYYNFKVLEIPKYHKQESDKKLLHLFNGLYGYGPLITL